MVVFVVVVVFVVIVEPVVVSELSFAVEVSLVSESGFEGGGGVGVEDDISVGKRLEDGIRDRKKDKLSYLDWSEVVFNVFISKVSGSEKIGSLKSGGNRDFCCPILRFVG